MQHAVTDDPHRGTIVLIEDDSNIRVACSELLRTSGYRVAAAATGVAGISLVCTELPDLVVTDITLPDLDGDDIVRVLRAHTPTRHIPIIAATANRDDPRPTDTALFVGVLFKPFAAGRLLALIEENMPARSQ